MEREREREQLIVYQANRDYEARLLRVGEWVEGGNLDLIMLIGVENLIESNPINRKWQGLWLFSLHSHLSRCSIKFHLLPARCVAVVVGSIILHSSVTNIHQSMLIGWLTFEAHLDPSSSSRPFSLLVSAFWLLSVSHRRRTGRVMDV